MTALNKQALREAAESIKTYYIHPMAFGSTQDHGHGHVPVVKADDFEKLRSELEAAEELYEDMLRQARSFREAHDSAAEIIRKLERNKPTVTLPTTRLWAGKVACYEECEIREILRAAGIGVKGE